MLGFIACRLMRSHGGEIDLMRDLPGGGPRAVGGRGSQRPGGHFYAGRPHDRRAGAARSHGIAGGAGQSVRHQIVFTADMTNIT